MIFKKFVVFSSYVILDILIFFSSQRDVVLLTSSTNIPEYLAETSHLASLGLLVLGWMTFLTLLLSNIFYSRYRFNLAFTFAILTYLPLMTIFIITLNYNHDSVMLSSLINYSFSYILLSLINIFIYTSITITTKRDIAIIKKIVLNLGARFLRLEIRDIAEKSKLNIKKVEDVVSEMIRNNEIYAKILEDIKVVEFNQNANVDEMDKLLEIYELWEQKSIKKK